MKNIFENAYFGKQYKTRDGHKAVFYNHHDAYARERARYVTMILESQEGIYRWYYDGTAHDKQEYLDIVSEWQEEIDEEKLDELADAETWRESDEFNSCLNDILALLDSHKRLKTIYQKGLIWAFKAGYRKAKEE